MSTAISSFRRHVTAEVKGCPNPLIDEKIVEAIQDFCVDTRWLEKGIEVEEIDYTTIDATDNDAIEIDLSTYVTDITPASITRFQIDGGDWDLEFKELVNDNSNLDQIVKQGVKFFNYPDEDTIKIYPFTDQSINFDVFLEIVFKPKDSITTIDDVFYDDHRKAIAAKAAAMLQLMPERAWTNIDHAKKNIGTYSHEMGLAKIDKMNGRITGSTRVNLSFFA